MSDKQLLGFASIPILGVLAQWVAWRFGLPSILLLLLTGFLVGPGFGLLDPDLLFGGLLVPIVSLSVSVILFEGGLSLKVSDLKDMGKVIRNLITFGAGITWVLISIAAYSFFGLSYKISILLGAILIVTGPTVIGPLLRQLKLKRSVASVLRWEGIVIDPIGAILAVLVFEVLFVTGNSEAFLVTLWILTRTLLFGGLLGIWGALVIMVIMENKWVPEFLQEVFTLIVVIGVSTLSNVMQSESGLLAVTIMGIILANQRKVLIKHIVTFKENLTLLLLSSIFIVLSSRLQLDEILAVLNFKSFLFVVTIILIRPLAVIISTSNSSLTIREKLFLSCMAPRGIVAAMVASLFSIRLIEMGYHTGESLVPITFLVIVASVTFYGLLSNRMAHFLKVKLVKNQGLVIIGAHRWARLIAKELKKEGFEIMLIDTNREHILSAKHDHLHVVQGSVFSQYVQEEVEMGGVGRLIALTSSDEVNLLSSLEFANILNPHDLYRLCPERKNIIDDSYSANYSKGSYLFGKGISYSYISAKILAGSTIQSITPPPGETIKDYLEKNDSTIPLFFITTRKRLIICSDRTSIPRLKHVKMICLSR